MDELGQIILATYNHHQNLLDSVQFPKHLRSMVDSDIVPGQICFSGKKKIVVYKKGPNGVHSTEGTYYNLRDLQVESHVPTVKSVNGNFLTFSDGRMFVVNRMLVNVPVHNQNLFRIVGFCIDQKVSIYECTPVDPAKVEGNQGTVDFNQDAGKAPPCGGT